MNKKSKEKNSDQKYWQDFLDNPSDIFDKDRLEKKNREQPLRYKFDFHGYSIENANKKVEELIFSCFEKEFKEILIVTGKGIHSDKEGDAYTSKQYSKLQNTLPDFIKNNPELNSKIQTIRKAPEEFGGDGALIIKLKKLKNKF